MTSNLNVDLTLFFSKNYNKPEYKEEKLFKQRYISVENLATTILKTDIKKGLNMLDKNDIEWRKKKYGTNEYFSSSESTPFSTFLSMSFEDPMIILIFIILILLIIIDSINEGIKTGYKEGFSIIICLLIYLSLNAYKDYNSKNKTIEYDKINKEKKCKVIRNNKAEIISNRDILVGDILVLNKGDVVEVDGFFTQEKQIGIDESQVFQGESKYKLKYKSISFIYDKVKNNYICPFIFAGTYVIEGSGYMVVANIGKNIYKNNKIFNEIMEEKNKDFENKDELYENMEIENNEDEIEEYLNNYGYYKILISALTEQISSIGCYFFVLLGFISCIKKTVIRMKEGYSFMSLDEVDIIINSCLICLLGYIFSLINSLFMIDLIGFLSDEKKMKKNNIIFKYEKYSELAFIDTLLIMDNKKPLIPGDNKNKEALKIIKNLKSLGINIIFLSENNIDNSIETAKELGIIENYEIEEGKKISKKYKNLVKQNLIVIQENPVCLEGNIFYSLCGDIEKKIRKNGSEKFKISKIDNFQKVINNLKIISNIRKEDISILMNGLKQTGKFISITGCTLNDLKLMKIANFSFGNNDDNDILKENYSLTLLDNSLNSFWNAYIYSTNLIYKILQYLKFFLTTFFTVLIANSIGILLFRDIPINIIPIIYIIFIVDIAAPPGVIEGNFCYKLLTRHKFAKNIPIINNKNLLNIIIHIISNIAILVYLMIKGNTLFDIESDRKLEHNMWNENNGFHVTILFCVLFFMVLIHLAFVVIEVNNNYVQFGFNICILILIQIWILNCGGKIFRTKPLSQNDLLKCFGIASLTIPLGIFTKIISR